MEISSGSVARLSILDASAFAGRLRLFGARLRRRPRPVQRLCRGRAAFLAALHAGARRSAAGELELIPSADLLRFLVAFDQTAFAVLGNESLSAHGAQAADWPRRHQPGAAQPAGGPPPGRGLSAGPSAPTVPGHPSGRSRM